MKKLILTLTLVLATLPIMAQQHGRHGHHAVESDLHIVYDAKGEPIKVADARQVDQIIEYVKGVSFDKEKAKAIELCVQLCPILAEDLCRIVRQMSFDDNKVELLKKVYYYCPDKQNYDLALESLTFSSNRDNVWRYIDKHYRHRR